MPDLDALGAEFREATDAIGRHRRVQAAAELERARWLKRHRGATGPELDRLDAAVDKARLDVEWCRSVTVAAGEAYKGEPLDEVLARNEAHRHLIRKF